MKDEVVYIGPTVDSDEDVRWIKVVSGDVMSEVPIWIRKIEADREKWKRQDELGELRFKLAKRKIVNWS